MGRLIDADDLKEYCKRASKFDDDFRSVSLATLASVIDAQPTAYDVDKVVEQFKCDDCDKCSFCEACAGSICCGICHEKAIEIVKEGGVDAKNNS